MGLTNLSDDLLDSILHDPDISHMVIKLWKCGCSSLNAKLARGITYVDLRHSPLLPSRFPRMLSKLRSLRYLAIRSTLKLFETPEDGLLELERLSECLESLCIDSPDAPSSVLNYAPPSRSQPQETSSTYALDHYGRGPSYLIDLGLMFPRLTSFELGNAYAHNDVASFPILRPSDAAGLPPTLTRLVIYSMVCDWRDTRLLSLLPPSLVHLDVRLTYENGVPQADVQADWLASPPQLRTIRFIKFGSNLKFYQKYDWLPKSLENGNFALSEFPTRFLVPQVSELPPLLQKLKFANKISDLELAQLPPFLTKLTLFGAAQYLLPTGIGCLPRTLTELRAEAVNSIDWRALDERSQSKEDLNTTLNLWPPKLHRLVIGRFKLEEHSRLLPRSLRSLDTAAVDGAIGDDLPTSLTYLSISGVVKLTSESKLPPSLTSLIALEASLYSLPRIPNSLVTLHLQSVPSGEFSMLLNQLPSLEELYLYRLEVATLIEYRPRFNVLKRLKISSLSGLHGPQSRDLFLNLPNSLQSINLMGEVRKEGEETVTLSPDSFAGLHHLTTLYLLARFPSFPKETLHRLPRSITILSIYILDYEAADLAFLPPHLKFCFISPAPNWNDPLTKVYWPCMNSQQPTDQEEALKVIEALRRVYYH